MHISKTLLPFLLTCIACTASYAGDKQQFDYNNKPAVYVSPLSFIDFKNPLLMVDAEYVLARYIGLGVGIGIPLSPNSTKAGNINIDTDLKLRGSLKFYLNDHKSYRTYFASKLVYRQTDFGSDSAYIYGPYANYIYDNLRATRYNRGIGFYVGGAFSPDGHFLLDWYAGFVHFDLRVDVKQGVEGEMINRQRRLIPQKNINYLSEVNGYYPSIGLSIGYIIGNTRQ